jgi:preprotein translocase subunit SecG
MELLLSAMLVIQMLSALAMIGLVLIQHGKGADMGASFGSGSSGSLFGATGSANFLSRSTAVCAAVFFCCTLALAYFGNARTAEAPSGSVLDRAAPGAGAASGAAPAAGEIPAAVPPAASDVAPAQPPAASGPPQIPTQ